MSLPPLAAVPVLPQEQPFASTSAREQDDTWLKPLWEYSFPPMADDEQLDKERPRQASQQAQTSSPGPSSVGNVSPRTKSTSGSTFKKRRKSKDAPAREGERSNRRRGENKEKRIMERCRGAPSWLTGKTSTIHPPPSSSFAGLPTSIIYPPQIPIPPSSHWVTNPLFPVQQTYNQVGLCARRGSMPPSFIHSSAGVNGPVESYGTGMTRTQSWGGPHTPISSALTTADHYSGVGMNDDITRRRASEPYTSMLGGTPLTFKSNCHINSSQASMGLLGTQSMGKSRETSGDGSVGDDWPGENSAVRANGMGRSNPLPTVTETQQLSSSYPAWLLMNTDPANIRDGPVHSFGPLTPSSIQTDLPTFTPITSYLPPPSTSFNPAPTYMTEPMNIDLLIPRHQSISTRWTNANPIPYFNGVDGPAHPPTDPAQQHQAFSYGRVEVSGGDWAMA
ncbi:hypothetical protein LQV05_002246 [Cryptococcus neoformans]|nr:hypothetical protein LQV05_002246 [Cryptococcus neoformans]